MKRLPFFILCLVPIWLSAQNHWGLKSTIQGSGEGFKPASAQAGTTGGSANFSVTFVNKCTETYTLKWDFSKDISTLKPGESFVCTLNPSEANDCNPGRSANIGLSVAGTTLSPVVAEKFPGVKFYNGFSGDHSRTSARHGKAKTEILVKGTPGNSPPAQTFILLRFDINTDHGSPERKSHSVNYEVIYVFEENFVPANSQNSAAACQKAEQKLLNAIKKNDELKRIYSSLSKLKAEFEAEAKFSFCVDPVEDPNSNLVNAYIEVPGDWDLKWKKRLSEAYQNTNETKVTYQLSKEMEKLSGLIDVLKKMSDVKEDKAIDNYRQLRESRDEVQRLIEATAWNFYCESLLPFFETLEEVDEEIYNCDDEKYEELAVRFEGIYLWKDYRKNKSKYMSGCQDRGFMR
jgi:hypothetical protein